MKKTLKNISDEVVKITNEEDNKYDASEKVLDYLEESLELLKDLEIYNKRNK